MLKISVTSLFPLARSFLSIYVFLLLSTFPPFLWVLGSAAGGEAGWWRVDAELTSSDWSTGYGGDAAAHHWLVAAVAAGASL